jgi:hypothetical protein
MIAAERRNSMSDLESSKVPNSGGHCSHCCQPAFQSLTIAICRANVAAASRLLESPRANIPAQGNCAVNATSPGPAWA